MTRDPIMEAVEAIGVSRHLRRAKERDEHFIILLRMIAKAYKWWTQTPLPAEPPTPLFGPFTEARAFVSLLSIASGETLEVSKALFYASLTLEEKEKP